MTIELSEYVIDAIADAIVKKMQVPTEEEKALLQKWHDNRGISMKDFEDAMDALEQEPKTDVLDKIRAEIETKYGQCDICEYFENYDYEENDISEYRPIGNVADILQIIDKHRAESEG